MNLKWNHKSILGFSDIDTVMLDFDNTTFKTVKYWALRTMNCLALIITKGGQANYDEIRDTVQESRESFGDLTDKYLKYTAIKRTLRTLIKKGYLSERSNIYRINPVMEVGFIQQFPIITSKAIKSNLRYRKEHIIEFDTTEVEDLLLNENNIQSSPYGLIENLKEALNLQKMGSYDSVLVKCGKCVEIMVNELDDDYSLFENDISTGNIINQLRNEKIVNKLKKIDKNDLRTFVDGIGLIYRFRNIKGAHVDWEWGHDQVAMSCLTLTFYLSDLYIWRIRKEAL